VGLAAGEAGEERVEVCAGERPIEWPGDLAVVRFEGGDACGERVEVSGAPRERATGLSLPPTAPLVNAG
jgi:hypothetical protein